MIGFLVGTACLLGLIRVVRGGRACGGWAYAGNGYGGGGCGDGRDVPGCGRDDRGHARGHRGGRGRGRGWGAPPWARGGEARGGFDPSFLLRAVFERLDTTPGQEKVIKAVVEDLQTKMRAAKDEAKASRGEVAKAMRAESFDEVLIGGATARLEGNVDTMRKAGIDAFAKVHEALDEKQRAILADVIESGPRGFFRGRHDHHHPYRGNAG